MQVIYRSDDGKEFNNEWDCEDYEWRLQHPSLSNVVCYDVDFNVLENLFSEDTYVNATMITVYTDEAAKDLGELGEYCGFCDYKDIVSRGIWKWDESSLNGKFVKGK